MLTFSPFPNNAHHILSCETKCFHTLNFNIHIYEQQLKVTVFLYDFISLSNSCGGILAHCSFQHRGFWLFLNYCFLKFLPHFLYFSKNQIKPELTGEIQGNKTNKFNVMKKSKDDGNVLMAEQEGQR